MRSTADYVAKIPPLNSRKPDFVATVTAVVSPLADTQAFLLGLPEEFDIDSAVGAQLDDVGEWVGQSRNVTIPVSQPWFAWDTASRGWDQGYWRGPNILHDYITQLDDDTYRRLLYSVVAANYGDGQTDSAQAALNIYFDDPATILRVLDVSVGIGVLQPFSWDVPSIGWDQAVWAGAGQFVNVTQPQIPTSDMRWVIGVAGRIPNVVDLEILAENLIRVTPAGVTRDVKVVTVDETPLFGWDLTNDFVSGWGEGSWGADPDFVAKNVL